MSKHSARPDFDSPEAHLARIVKAAVAGAFAAGLLLVAACSEGGSAVVKDAVAAPVEVSAGYLPAHFPSPEGAPEPHVEAF